MGVDEGNLLVPGVERYIPTRQVAVMMQKLNKIDCNIRSRT